MFKTSGFAFKHPVDDINPDSLLQNVTYTGWPKSRQDIRYLTHWLSKIQNSVGGFEDFFEKIGDFGMGNSILHKKEGLKVSRCKISYSFLS